MNYHIGRTKGFTLIEAIVGIMLAFIVTGSAIALLFSTTNIIGNSVKDAECITIGDQTANFIVKNLRYASNIEIVKGPEPPAITDDAGIIFVGNTKNSGTYEAASRGKLYFGNPGGKTAININGDDYYKMTSLSMTCKSDIPNKAGEPKFITISVTVWDEDGNRKYTAENKFEIKNSGEMNEPLSSATADSLKQEFFIVYKEAVTLDEQEMIGTNDMILNGYYSESLTQPWEVKKTGDYLIECWGADGGRIDGFLTTGKNGMGGYAAGTVHLEEGTFLYLHAGSDGQAMETKSQAAVNAIYNAGGSNGGGQGKNSTDNPSTAKKSTRTGGGGAADVRIGQNDLNHRIIVAGGGGGNAGELKTMMAGNGGGESGEDGQQAPGNKSTQNVGRGGTQTAGGVSAGTTQVAVSGFGYGGGINNGNGTIYNAGGGGGWYGGGSGRPGGGGSGYVLTDKSEKPTGYLSDFTIDEVTALYFKNPVNAKIGDADFVPRPAGAKNCGFIKITYIK